MLNTIHASCGLCWSAGCLTSENNNSENSKFGFRKYHLEITYRWREMSRMVPRTNHSVDDLWNRARPNRWWWVLHVSRRLLGEVFLRQVRWCNVNMLHTIGGLRKESLGESMSRITRPAVSFGRWDDVVLKSIHGTRWCQLWALQDGTCRPRIWPWNILTNTVIVCSLVGWRWQVGLWHTG